jgi:hypothetical protein
MLNEQEDESLGVEQLPQTELESTPGGGEKPASDPNNVEMIDKSRSDQSQARFTDVPRDRNPSQDQ